ncbi:stage II sporulation protein M [Methanobrevibacter sp.]|uniref:stage II sporulation protein M n=1 Tax=Methanobrevibacter sp. TaxID=66852 RepID=UPI00388E2B73
MSFLDSYFKYLRSAFVEHKYLLIFTILFAASCWIGTYFLADYIFTPYELADLAYLSQETQFSFLDMMVIIINNCYINVLSYIGAIFFCLGPVYDMTFNIGMSGIVSRATELACGDPFLFLKLTCLHGFFEDASTVLNSFAGFLLFYFIIKSIKDIFKPSQHLANGAITNSLEINKILLYQSLAVFVLGFLVMIFAGFLEEYISIPFGNMIANLF